MKVADRMADKIRDSIRSFLRIEPAQKNTFSIMETLDFDGNAARNRVWYRGEADELSQLYKVMPGDGNRSKFWAAVPTTGREIRKIHTGIPQIVVDVLTGIVLTDLNGIDMEPGKQELWDVIADENQLYDLLEQAVSETLVIGDGAFKVSIDSGISEYPLIEYVPGERIDIETRCGRVTEITFRTQYTHNFTVYTLFERYGYGYIRYELKRQNTTVDIDSIPQTQGLEDVEFDNSFMMALQFRIFISNRYSGRGKSIYDGKTDNYDALDEAWSQWMDALRKGRSKEYIPSDMLPRNPHTGEIMKPNAFDNAYIEHDSPMSEGTQKKIEVVQPEIPHQSYLSTYVTCLDMCLQGIISPSTLGIDGNKLKDDTATAQLEREKVTVYTRNKIIEAMTRQIPKLVDIVLKTYDTMNRRTPSDTEAVINFGEYSSPGFDAVADTVGKAKQNGIMSIEAAVDELYGDSKDDEWKQEEVARLKAEQGIAEMEEPQVADDDELFRMAEERI